MIFRPIIDSDTVITGLEDMGIVMSNIVFAAIYLSFINSFIEEFFFRGFIYQHFSSINGTLGYIVSGALFSIYHVLVMFTIFNWIMGVLSIIGLMIVGIGLAYMNKSNKSIINSWIVHIFADLAVVTIALYLLMIN